MNMNEAIRTGSPYYVTTRGGYGVAPVSLHECKTRGVVYFATYYEACAHCDTLNKQWGAS